jgi:hypothetical protein
MALVGVGGRVCWHGHRGSQQVLGVGIVGGRVLEPVRGAPGSDGVTATGMDETAPSGASVSHEHQRPRRVQNSSAVGAVGIRYNGRAAKFGRLWPVVRQARLTIVVVLMLLPRARS